MYQTLNCIPPPPGSVNNAVPDMLNFIVAKALAKGLDDRYQSAKDLAGDLNACRDNMIRDAAISSVQKSILSVADATALVPRLDEKEGAETAALGLSTVFDSFGATLRLAALTASSEEVDLLSKTFKMVRPNMDDINLAANKISDDPSAPLDTSSASAEISSDTDEPEKPKLSPEKKEMILIAVTVLVSILLIVAILH
jgi:serine/threonine-protein kinase